MSWHMSLSGQHQLFGSPELSRTSGKMEGVHGQLVCGINFPVTLVKSRSQLPGETVINFTLSALGSKNTDLPSPSLAFLALFVLSMPHPPHGCSMWLVTYTRFTCVQLSVMFPVEDLLHSRLGVGWGTARVALAFSTEPLVSALATHSRYPAVVGQSL